MSAQTLGHTNSQCLINIMISAWFTCDGSPSSVWSCSGNRLISTTKCQHLKTQPRIKDEVLFKKTERELSRKYLKCLQIKHGAGGNERQSRQGGLMKPISKLWCHTVELEQTMWINTSTKAPSYQRVEGSLRIHQQPLWMVDQLPTQPLPVTLPFRQWCKVLQ